MKELCSTHDTTLIDGTLLFALRCIGRIYIFHIYIYRSPFSPCIGCAFIRPWHSGRLAWLCPALGPGNSWQSSWGWSMPWIVLASISGTVPIPPFSYSIFSADKSTSRLLGSHHVPPLLPASLLFICCAPLYMDENPSQWPVSPPNLNNSSFHSHRQHLNGSCCGHGYHDGLRCDGLCRRFGIRPAAREKKREREIERA